ncbi:hypothetical protein [Stratiformator vulcanicus]|uniref:Rho termination factor N-terminal domain-containing protein n=1 Tax=Stratiformator vulcanicus TaxID=2527980 RepID=A0A517R4S7_9PLAN|nr:hypothetical protein Pan189_32880 [Stratiformator vulcanicus]
MREEQLRQLDKSDLEDIARSERISGRSRMSKRKLARALYQHFRSRNDEPTKQELYEEAKRLEIDGRSKMNRDELKQAVEEHRVN